MPHDDKQHDTTNTASGFSLDELYARTEKDARQFLSRLSAEASHTVCRQLAEAGVNMDDTTASAMAAQLVTIAAEKVLLIAARATCERVKESGQVPEEIAASLPEFAEQQLSGFDSMVEIYLCYLNNLMTLGRTLQQRDEVIKHNHGLGQRLQQLQRQMEPSAN